MRGRALLFGAFLVCGCGAEPAEELDAGAEPEVVSTWRQLPSPFSSAPTPEADRRVYTFYDDGTYTLDNEPIQANAGTYTMISGRIDLASVTRTIAYDYYADDEMMLLYAFDADDDGADPMGTWTGWTVVDDVYRDAYLEIRDDGTVTYTEVYSFGTYPREGTWQQIGDAVRMAFSDWTPVVRIRDGHLGDGWERL
jgi:hypothetical protein